MIAYAHVVMGWWKRLREGVAGPPHVSGGGDDPGEFAATMHEEYSVANAGDTEMRDIEEHSHESPGPIAAAPFAGEGQIRAAELEAEIVKPGDVTPDGAEIEPDEGPTAPNS
jgi:hypothetical protein